MTYDLWEFHGRKLRNTLSALSSQSQFGDGPTYQTDYSGYQVDWKVQLLIWDTRLYSRLPWFSHFFPILYPQHGPASWPKGGSRNEFCHHIEIFPPTRRSSTYLLEQSCFKSCQISVSKVEVGQR